MDIRTGFGFDSHKLVAGREMILGGVKIPAEHGPSGLSDADVVIHALCDALLGAMGEKDIGEHFPDYSPENKDRNSREFLIQVMDKVKSRGYKISNIDITIILESPPLKGYKEKIKSNLAHILEIDESRISVKAKRPESAFPPDAIISFTSLILYHPQP
jgi:2-C-methyl-D-erythritol 2,4-cyclodiphosphate synthase